MPRKLIWTEGQDTQIRRLRTEGASWDLIAIALGLARWTVIERGRTIGVHRAPANAVPVLDEADREPLPAGHVGKLGCHQPRHQPRGRALPDPRHHPLNAP